VALSGEHDDASTKPIDHRLGNHEESVDTSDFHRVKRRHQVVGACYLHRHEAKAEGGRAAVETLRDARVARHAGLATIPTREMPGIASLSSASSLPAESMLSIVIPVTLLEGRPRLAISPCSTASMVGITTGIVELPALRRRAMPTDQRQQ